MKLLVVPFRANGTHARGASGRPASLARFGRPRFPIGLATLAVLIALTGCNDPMVKRQMGRREASMSWTVNTAVKNEQAAPQRLNDSFAFIGKDTVWHAQATDRDLHDLQGYLEFDLHRFKERQAEYLKKGGEILWSEPEQIGRSAAIMFL